MAGSGLGAGPRELVVQLFYPARRTLAPALLGFPEEYVRAEDGAFRSAVDELEGRVELRVF